MKSSIRNFLLINLLLAITAITATTAIGNYYLDQKEIQDHLDTLMAISALSYQALLGDDVHQRPLKKIQKVLDTIPKRIHSYYQKPLFSVAAPDMTKFNFQVWSDDGKLLLHSAHAPKIPLAHTYGFSDNQTNNQTWRVFTTYNNQTGVKTELAEHYDTRNELGHRIAQDDFYIMLLTFPISGLFIWIVVGRGLNSLKRIADEVANRATTNLHPVNIEEVPQEVKPLIDELNKLFYRLKEGFEREKRFAADAAHELRTPLAALKAQAQVALNTKTIAGKDEALHKLIASVNRSTHIVQQLLTMSKLVPEAASLHEINYINLGKLTREVLAMIAPMAVEKKIELEFIEAKKIPAIAGNATTIGLLIRNLVDNAIRYSTEGGHVLVRLAMQEDRQILLEVVDNGPGIPDELRDRVFERFFRIWGNKSTGSGLGLPIVRQICELHGGHVELDTPEKGSGLIVRVFLPIASKQPQ